VGSVRLCNGVQRTQVLKHKLHQPTNHPCHPPTHLQGTTVLMALLSSRPWWSERIHLAVLLAPVAVATHVGSPLLVALAKLNTDEIFTLLGISEFLPSSDVLSRLDGQLCRLQPHVSAALCCAAMRCAVLCCAVLCCAVLCCAVLCCATFSTFLGRFTTPTSTPLIHPPSQPPPHPPTINVHHQMCINILAMIAGYNIDNVDLQRLPIYLNYTPSGTSVTNMAHWCQVRVPCVWAAASSIEWLDAQSQACASSWLRSRGCFRSLALQPLITTPSPHHHHHTTTDTTAPKSPLPAPPRLCGSATR